MTAPTLADEIAALRSLIEETEVTAAGYRKWAMRRDRDNFAALRCALARLEAMRWRPIEAAPKNGIAIEGFGQWVGEINGPDHDNPETICIIRWDGGRTDYPGYDWKVAHSDAYAEWFKPLAWRPLPSPPEPQEVTERDG